MTIFNRSVSLMNHCILQERQVQIKFRLIIWSYLNTKSPDPFRIRPIVCMRKLALGTYLFSRCSSYAYFLRELSAMFSVSSWKMPGYFLLTRRFIVGLLCTAIPEARTFLSSTLHQSAKQKYLSKSDVISCLCSLREQLVEVKVI